MNGPPACASLTCGDGVVDESEECDEGAANGTPGSLCHAGCIAAVCGDGVVDAAGEPAEACDDGLLNDDFAPDACRRSCQAPRCGDGIVDEGEARSCLTPADLPGAQFGAVGSRFGDFDANGFTDVLVTYMEGPDRFELFFKESPTAYASRVVDLGLADDAILADLNGDGRTDLVALGPGSQAITYLQDAGREFAPAFSVPASGGRHSWEVADLDLDGDDDLILITDPPGVAWVPSLGDGRFGPAQPIYTSPDYAWSYFGELDGEPPLDLVIYEVSEATGEATLVTLRSTGPGAWAPPEALAIGDAEPLVVDADGDGLDDVLLLSATGDPGADQVLLSLGDAWAAPLALPVAGATIFTDVDGDGHDELGFMDGTRLRRFQLDDGSLVELAAVDLPTPGSQFFEADVDDDGFRDVLTDDALLRLVMLRGGDGPLGAGLTAASATPVGAAVAAGAGDLGPVVAWVAEDRLHTAMLPRGVRVGRRTATDLPATVDAVLAGDVDGDGKTDVVAHSYQMSDGQLRLFRGDGAGGFVAGAVVDEASLLVAGVDLDGDGAIELVALYQDGAVVRRGADLVPTVILWADGDPTRGMELVDQDGDGHVDVIRHIPDVGLRVHRGDGAGGFATEGVTVLPWVGEPQLVVLDVVPGGFAELLVAGAIGLELWTADAAGAYAEALDLPTLGIPYRARATDVNRDGVRDLLVTGNGWELLYGRGDGSFAAPVPLEPFEEVLGDFELRGRTFLLVGRRHGIALRPGSATPSTP